MKTTEDFYNIIDDYMGHIQLLNDMCLSEWSQIGVSSRVLGSSPKRSQDVLSPDTRSDCTHQEWKRE